MDLSLIRSWRPRDWSATAATSEPIVTPQGDRRRRPRAAIPSHKLCASRCFMPIKC